MLYKTVVLVWNSVSDGFWAWKHKVRLLIRYRLIKVAMYLN